MSLPHLEFKCSVVLRLLCLLAALIFSALVREPDSLLSLVFYFCLAALLVPDYAIRKALWQNSALNKVIAPLRLYSLAWGVGLLCSCSLEFLLVFLRRTDNAFTPHDMNISLHLVLVGVVGVMISMMIICYREKRVRERLLNFLYIEFEGNEKETTKKTSTQSLGKQRLHGSLQLF